VTAPPSGPYNPLDKINIAKSIEGELLARPVQPLAEIGNFSGAGVYAIYYTGVFPAYERIVALNSQDAFAQPIYVGKAIPTGGRKGGLTKDSADGTALVKRLRKHASSVDDASNLKLSDFHFRYLIVDDVWIPLGENMLIETFKPVWNRAIDGFGNNDPGKRRSTQYKSPWDVLRPGRKYADKLGDSGVESQFLIERVDDYLSGRPLKPLPKKLAEQIAEQAEADVEAADEA
jgi:hypothetical protein